MKKTVSILVALVLALTLCACGGQKEAATMEAAPAIEPAAALEAAPAAEASASTEPAAASANEGNASGESSGSGEATGESQSFALYPTAGFAKTFDGYKDWVKAAFQSNERIANLEDKLAAIDAVTEQTYSPDAQPFSMQIQFGLICSYEDFLKQ